MNILKKIFGRQQPATVNQLLVVEGVEGVFYYHLRVPGNRGALCGESRVMQTSIPVDAWGYKSHLHERYCPKCSQLAVQNETNR